MLPRLGVLNQIAYLGVVVNHASWRAASYQPGIIWESAVNEISPIEPAQTIRCACVLLKRPPLAVAVPDVLHPEPDRPIFLFNHRVASGRFQIARQIVHQTGLI